MWLSNHGVKVLAFLLILAKNFLQEVNCIHSTICVAMLTPDRPTEGQMKWMRYGSGQKTFGIEKFHNLALHYIKYFEPRSGGILKNQLGTTSPGTEETTRFFGRSLNPDKHHTTLKLYRIKQKHPEKYLRGWYRVEFCGMNLRDEWSSIVLTVRDDSNRRQDIGEFSQNFPAGPGINKCPASDFTRYMILSCGGASRAEPLVANAFTWNIHGYDYTLGYTLDNLREGSNSCWNMYVRIPIQDCNQKKTLVFEARAHLYNPDHVIFVHRTYLRLTSNPQDGTWIQGAADAIPSKTRAIGLDCSEEIRAERVPWFAMQKSTATQKNYEFQETGKDTPDEDKFDYIRACQARHFQGRCGDNMCTLVRKHSTWYDINRKGMRTLTHQNTAVETQIPICEHKLDDEPNFYGMDCGKTYQKPTKFNEKAVQFRDTATYLKQNHVPCSFGYADLATCKIVGPVKGPHTPAKVAFARSAPLDDSYNDNIGDNGPVARGGIGVYLREAPSTTPKPAEKTAFTGNGQNPEVDKYRGIAFNGTGFPQLLWACRKGHATLMTIVFFLLLPVNLLVTRYFKETFMGSRILHSRVWYVVHLHATFSIMSLLLAGLAVAVVGGRYMGHSLTIPAIVHRALGYTAIGLFALMVLLGGLRGFEDPLRRITITLHWIFGHLFYVMMVALFVTAVFIPGSGVTSAKRDASMTWQWKDKNVTEPTWFIESLIHLIIWVAVEFIFHIIFMILVCQSDRAMEVVQSRIHFPVLIPILREISSKNASGYLIRVIFLCIYLFLAIVSFSIYVLLNLILLQPQSDLHNYSLGTGPMSCTHYPSNFTIMPDFATSCI